MKLNSIARVVLESTIPRDFWHGYRRVGSQFTPGVVRGYYCDLTGKTHSYSGSTSSDGVPLVSLGLNKGYTLHPVTVCQVALGWHERWLRERSESCGVRFLSLVDWLVENQVSHPRLGGIWQVPYSVPLYSLRAGWISALVQGQAISALLRSYQLTGDSRYLAAASNAVQPFTIDVSDGGVSTTDQNGHTYFEEYPSTPSSRVLNGFIYSLWGLYDHAILTREPISEDLLDAGLSTLIQDLALYDTGYWSKYNLFERTGFSSVASPYYHIEHIAQLRATYTLTCSDTFRETADRWDAYTRHLANTARVVVHKGLSRIYRMITEERVTQA